jgi:hypothetical protein
MGRPLLPTLFFSLISFFLFNNSMFFKNLKLLGFTNFNLFHGVIFMGQHKSLQYTGNQNS